MFALNFLCFLAVVVVLSRFYFFSHFLLSVIFRSILGQDLLKAFTDSNSGSSNASNSNNNNKDNNNNNSVSISEPTSGYPDMVVCCVVVMVQECQE